MLRPLANGLLLLLLLTPSVLAEDAEPRLRSQDFELLPLNDLEKQELLRDNPKLGKEIRLLSQRATKLRKLLMSRKDRHDDGSRKIAGQVQQVEARLEPLMQRVVEVTRRHGVDAALLRGIAAAPGGPHRVARYAMGQVLVDEALPQRQQALFEALFPRVEGGLLALGAQRGRLARTLRQSSLNEKQVDAALAALDGHVRQIEKRFWRLVDYLVPEAQRAEVHRRLPTAYQKQESIIEHIYALPGFSPTQGLRIQALLTEIEAEGAPEAAAVKRLERRLKSQGQQSDLTAAERRDLEAELKATRLRQITLLRDAVVRAKQILSAAQWVTLEAIPPRVSINDRKQTSVQLLEDIDLSAGQRAELLRMRRSLSEPRRLFREKRLAAMVRMSQYGPDSPQMAGMQMEMAGIQSEGNAIQRQFNGRILLELLRTDQVLGWILGRPKGD